MEKPHTPSNSCCTYLDTHKKGKISGKGVDLKILKIHTMFSKIVHVRLYIAVA
jgi:hypothetical protein